MSGGLILVTWLGDASGSLELAAVLAVTATRRRDRGERAAALLELGEPRPSAPTMIASAAARETEASLAEATSGRAAARGWICHLRLSADTEGAGVAKAAVAALPESTVGVLHAEPALLRALAEERELGPRGVVLRADLERDRSLAALTAGDLSSRGLRVRVAKRPPAWLAGRLALAGLSPGQGPERAGRQLLTRLLAPVRGGADERRGKSGSRSFGMIVEC